MVSAASRATTSCQSGDARQQTLGEQPQHQREGRRLRPDGQICGDRSGGPLVGVGRPHVERRSRDLEAQPDDYQHEAGHQPRTRPRSSGQRLADAVEPGRPQKAVYLADPEQQESGREGSQEDVLDARLVRPGVVPVIGHQDVQAEAEQLEGDVGGEQLARAGEEHHAHDGEEQDRRSTRRGGRGGGAHTPWT